VYGLPFCGDVGGGTCLLARSATTAVALVPARPPPSRRCELVSAVAHASPPTPERWCVVGHHFRRMPVPQAVVVYRVALLVSRSVIDLLVCFSRRRAVSPTWLLSPSPPRLAADQARDATLAGALSTSNGVGWQPSPLVLRHCRFVSGRGYTCRSLQCSQYARSCSWLVLVWGAGVLGCGRDRVDGRHGNSGVRTALD